MLHCCCTRTAFYPMLTLKHHSTLRQYLGQYRELHTAFSIWNNVLQICSRKLPSVYMFLFSFSKQGFSLQVRNIQVCV